MVPVRTNSSRLVSLSITDSLQLKETKVQLVFTLIRSSPFLRVQAILSHHKYSTVWVLLHWWPDLESCWVPTASCSVVSIPQEEEFIGSGHYITSHVFNDQTNSRKYSIIIFVIKKRSQLLSGLHLKPATAKASAGFGDVWKIGSHIFFIFL